MQSTHVASQTPGNTGTPQSATKAPLRTESWYSRSSHSQTPSAMTKGEERDAPREKDGIRRPEALKTKHAAVTVSLRNPFGAVAKK